MQSRSPRKTKGERSRGFWLLSIPSTWMWSSSWLGMEGSNVQVLIHKREWGLGEEIDHLLILANLAGEHCLSVQRDGQNDWLPVAAGSLALTYQHSLHLILNRCLAYSSRVCCFISLSLSQGLTQTPPCLTTNR